MAEHRYSVDDILKEINEKKKNSPPRVQSPNPETIVTSNSVHSTDLLASGSRLDSSEINTELSNESSNVESITEVLSDVSSEPVQEEIQDDAFFSSGFLVEGIEPDMEKDGLQFDSVDFSESFGKPIDSIDGTDLPDIYPSERFSSFVSNSLQDLIQELKTKKKHSIVSLIVSFVSFFGVLFLAVAPQFNLVIPFLASDSLRIWGMVGFVLVAALFSLGVLGNGFIALFPKHASNDAYVTLTIFAVLLQGSFMALHPETIEKFGNLIFLPIGPAILFFHHWGMLLGLTRRIQSAQYAQHYNNISPFYHEGSSLYQWCEKSFGEPVHILSASPTQRSVSPVSIIDCGRTESLSSIMAPVTICAALVMAVLSVFLQGDIFVAASTFTAALCMTSPLFASIASNLPLLRTNRKLKVTKSNILHESVVSTLSESDAVLFSVHDLFEDNSVVLHNVHAYDKKNINEALFNAASILKCADSILFRAFSKILPNDFPLKSISNLSIENGLGIVAWVNDNRMLIGNRQFMNKYQIIIPDDSFCESDSNDNSLFYLTYMGDLVANIDIRYQTNSALINELQHIQNNGVHLLLSDGEPLLDTKKLADIFHLDEEYLDYIPSAYHRDFSHAIEIHSDDEPLLVSHSKEGYFRSLRSSFRLASISKVVSALLVANVLLGFAFTTFLSYSNALSRLTWVAVLLYQLVWGVLLWIVCLFSNR